MTTTLESRTISVRIACDWRAAYAFAAVPENLGRWASGLGKSFRKLNGEWVAEGPDGPIRVRFTEHNPLGVLDHYVVSAAGAEGYVPMRIIANGSGCEAMLTLFRLPGMTDERFAADAEWIERDLRALKTLLEA